MGISLSITIFLAATFVSFLVIVYFYEWHYAYPAALRERLQEMESNEHASSTWVFKQTSAMKPSRFGVEQLTQLLARWCEQAGVQRLPSTVLTHCLMAGVVTGVALITFAPIWLLPLATVAAWLPVFHLFYLRSQRQRVISQQLPSVFQTLSRTVRSGQTIPGAMQIIAETFEEPIAGEFARCCDQQTLGVGRETSLRELAERVGVMELQIFVVALLVQSRSGGDINRMFENLATMSRKRQHFEQRSRALTGEGRMQAVVLIALPIVAFIAIYLISPDYVATLLDRPALLVAMALLQIVGSLWIRKIVRIDV